MLSPAEFERLDTWLQEITEALCDGRVHWSSEGDERKARGKNLGGLSINVRKGCWYCHAKGKGGGPVELILFLKGGCNRADAVQWAQAWLKSHPGIGKAGEASERCPEIDAAEIAQGLIEGLVEPVGTPAEAYLQSRGITIPPPPCVKFLPNARTGEGAIAGLLTARGRTVGLQLGYLDSGGRKSTVSPHRRRFNVEKAHDAVFELRTGTGPLTIVAEGLEDGLSVLKATPDRATGVLALPGIGGLAGLPAKSGDNFIIVRDGDPPDSRAADGLRDGVDHLILAGANVWVVDMPAGKDANDILRENGPDALHHLIVNAAPVKLSVIGEIKRCVGQAEIDYALDRKETAKRLGIRVSDLDAERERHRRQEPEGQADDPDAIELLDEPVALADALDEIERVARKYIVATTHDFTILALWSAHAHIVHHQHVRLHRSPRLAIQAIDKGSGKTVLLEIVTELVPRPILGSSVTASSVLRVIDELKPCLLIDEADNVLKDRNSDLLGIPNCGDRRKSARVYRSVPTSNSGWLVQSFSVFGAAAFAGIGELPATLQDRSIVIRMVRARYKEIPGHLRDATSPELVMLRRELATWSADLRPEDLNLDPEMPEVLQRQAGRVGDNSRILFAIAEAAGPKWRHRVEASAEASLGAERKESLLERLLTSIRRAFDTEHPVVDLTTGKVAKDSAGKARYERSDRFTTEDLIDKLLDDREEEWSRINDRGPISAYWLRDHLGGGLLRPPGTRQWREKNPEGVTERCRGYKRSQFERVWELYTREEATEVDDDDEGDIHAPTPPQTSGASVSYGETQENSHFQAGQSDPGAAHVGQNGPDEVQSSPDGAEAAPYADGVGQVAPDENIIKSTEYPHAPDAPDVSGGSRVYVPDGDNFHGKGGASAEVEKPAPAVRPKRARGTKPKQDPIEQKEAPPASESSTEESAAAPLPPSAGNGADQPPPTTRRSWQDADLISDMRAFAAEHPNWPLAKIAAEFGQPMAAVRKLFPGRD
jgi:hypothetical protein